MEDKTKLPLRENFIQLEEAEILTSGQNFFDQAPFRSIIQTVSEETETDPMKLNCLIVSITHVPNGLFGIGAWDNLQNIEKYMQKQSSQIGESAIKAIASFEIGAKRLFQFRRKFEIGEGDKPRYDEAAVKLVIALREYPYWAMYVGTQFDKQYNSDGSFYVNKRIVPAFPKTYAHWVTDKLRLEEAIKMKGIEEIFPERFIPPTPRGESPIRRKFTILKASEIVK